MGNFYVNHTVRAGRDEVVATLAAAKRSAFVGGAGDGYTVVFDRECDDQDVDAIVALGRELSRRHTGPVLAVLNHDDDILAYWLFENDAVVDTYNSDPDYFGDGDGDESAASVEQATRLIAEVQDAASRMVVGHASVGDVFAHVHSLMAAARGDSTPAGEETSAPEDLGAALCRAYGRTEFAADVRKILASRKYVFAVERHQELFNTLGLPEMSVGGGYAYLDDREFLDDAVVRVEPR